MLPYLVPSDKISSLPFTFTFPFKLRETVRGFTSMLFALLSLAVSERSFKIVGNEFQMDGKPFQYVSGSFHYFRQDPDLWEDTIKKMANGGLNAIQTYVAWNIHEPEKGQYVWTGLGDIERFLDLCQKYNMFVILRPGPYICAEWDLGGLPYWLMNEDIEFFRSNDPVYMQHVTEWFTLLYKRVNKYMYHNGGNIIMVQIENEYGAYFACDKVYLKALVDLAHQGLGEQTVLFTVDNNYDWMWKCGGLPEYTLSTIDFGTSVDVKTAFEQQRSWNNGTGPYVNTEYYTGWLDHWGDDHHTVAAEEVAKHLDEMLAMGGSVNFYMYYGGTNFDYMTGANGDTAFWYQADPTSYDYDAPLSEATDLTWKYWKLLEVIKKYRTDIPTYDVQNSTKKSFGSVTFTEGIKMFDCLEDIVSRTEESDTPMYFEKLNNPFGFVLYETTAQQAGHFMVTRVGDRAVVIKNGQYAETFTRTESKSLWVDSGDKLQILCQHLGRLNFGYDLHMDFKGLRGKVTIGSHEVKGWSNKAIPLSSAPSHLKFAYGVLPVHEPAFYRGYFNVDEPADTFFNPTGFKCGVCWVNGKHIGKYWSAGPQITLYIRAKYLKPGQNEIIIFETGDIDTVPVCTFDDHPTLDAKPGPFTSKRRFQGHY